jgi:hypothetical protein
MRWILPLVLALALAGCGEPDVPQQAAPTTAAPTVTAPTDTTPTAPAETGEPADDGAGQQPIPAIPRRDTGAQPPDPELFFYFPDEENARAAAAELDEHGYRVRTTPPEGEIKEWSVIAEGTPDAPSLKVAEKAFRPWAEARGGSYDGNEIPLGP